MWFRRFAHLSLLVMHCRGYIKKRAVQVCMPGSRLRDVWRKTLRLELQICLHELMPHFITSQSGKLPPPLLYLDYKKPFKTLNGEGWASWSWLLSLLGFMCSIRRSSLAWGWVDVKCGHRLWARSTSLVSVEMTGRQEGLPARSAVANSRWQPRSEKLASNGAGLRRSSLVTTWRNICLLQLCEIPWIVFCTIELRPLPSAHNETFISDIDSQKKGPSAYERRSFAFICSLWWVTSHFIRPLEASRPER